MNPRTPPPECGPIDWTWHPVEAFCLGSRRHEDDCDPRAVVAYVSKGVYVGVDLAGLGVWTDGYWVWSDVDIELAARPDLAPADRRFIDDVNSLVGPCEVPGDVLDEIARCYSGGCTRPGAAV